MNKTNHGLSSDAMDMLATTSRTFYIPISRLAPKLKEAVAAAYLCMRAIDEIEDHIELSSADKIKLLLAISDRFKVLSQNNTSLLSLFHPYQERLPAVTLRLNEWSMLCPSSVAPIVLKSTAAMAEAMAGWVEKEWKIKTERDLDHYTYCVAGAVGELLSEIWMWYDGIETNREKAVAFGRGLQAVNIIRNRKDDLERGVDYFPSNWGMDEMVAYASRNLALADDYVADIKSPPVSEFCRIPLALAHGTLSAIANGEKKLNRAAVLEIVNRVAGQTT